MSVHKIEKMVCDVEYGNQLKTVGVRWMLLLNTMKFNDLSQLVICWLIKVRYNKNVCLKYPKSLTNVVELILIVQDALPLNKFEAPLADKNRNGTNNIVENFNSLKQDIEVVGQQLVCLETCVVDIRIENHDIFDNLLLNVNKC